ncbi:MAG: GH-E family nuclease, partial [Bacteroidota bacterium]
ITKTGRLDMATRLAFMGRQMMTGLQVFWNKNKVWIIAALVAALIAAGLIAFFTGGAGLVAAVDIIVKALVIIFGAYAVFQAMGHIWDYVKKAWAGDAVGAGKSLAMAMAVIVMEFLLDKILLGMGKVFKRIIAAAKTTRIGQKVMKGVNFVRKGVTRTGNVIKKGVARIKNTRLVVRMRGVVGKGTKKLSNLRQRILQKFKFRRIWLERSGRWIQLWGEFNAKVLLAQDDAQGNRVVDVDSSTLRKNADSRQIVGSKVDVDGQQGIVISDRGSQYADEVADLSKADQTARYNQLDNLTDDAARGDRIRGGVKSERVSLRQDVRDSVFAKADSGRVDANGNKIYVDRRQKPPVDIPNYGTHYPKETPLGKPHPKAGQPVPENLVGKPRADIGHVKGQTWEQRLAKHKEAGHTRKQIIEAEQNPDLYILEERSSNRSRRLD